MTIHWYSGRPANATHRIQTGRRSQKRSTAAASGSPVASSKARGKGPVPPEVGEYAAGAGVAVALEHVLDEGAGDGVGPAGRRRPPGEQALEVGERTSRRGGCGSRPPGTGPRTRPGRSAARASPSLNHRGTGRPRAARENRTWATSCCSSASSESVGYRRVRSGNRTTRLRPPAAKPEIHDGVLRASSEPSAMRRTSIGGPGSVRPARVMALASPLRGKRPTRSATVRSDSGASISSTGARGWAAGWAAPARSVVRARTTAGRRALIESSRPRRTACG